MPHAAQEDVKLKRKSNTGNSLYWFILAGINLDIEFKRQKAWPNWCKKHNFDDSEQFYSFLEVKQKQFLAKPDKDKYDVRDKKQNNILVKQPDLASQFECT